MAKSTKTTKSQEKKFSLEELRTAMSSVVREVILWTTERIPGQDRPVKINFRHQVARVEQELSKGPIEIHARGIGGAGLVADLANYYINKQTDGYKIIQHPEFIISTRPGRKDDKGKATSVPIYDVTFSLEGPFVSTNIFEELKK